MDIRTRAFALTLCIHCSIAAAIGCGGSKLGGQPPRDAGMDGGGTSIVDSGAVHRDSGERLDAAIDGGPAADTSHADASNLDAGLDAGREDAGTDAGPPSVCGDGRLAADEACEDGNTLSGDGCSPLCAVEAGWKCTAADGCKPICGDAIKTGDEVCDDGNHVDNDYCSNDCHSAHACGDAKIQTGAGESCDDGNTETESCSYGQLSCKVCDAMCHTQDGKPHYCGDGTIDSGQGEECDDGNNVDGDGCSAMCKVVAVSTCGNSMVDTGEQCDDGNTNNLDGCNAACKKEVGWNCPTVGTACTSICGDGHKVGSEECDDGNTATEACNYGQTSCVVCNAMCKTQAGATSYCGDGHVDSNHAEECDTTNDIRCTSCRRTCDTVFISYDATGSFQVTDTTLNLANGTYAQTGGKLVVALPAGPTGPVPGAASVIYVNSPVTTMKTISFGGTTTIKTDVVGTAGTATNLCPLNTGTLDSSGVITWNACPYLGSHGTANWTPAQQQVASGQGPGCLVYTSKGNVNCSGGLCSATGLKSGDNAQDDTWDQPSASFTLSNAFSKVSARAIGAPGDGPGDKVEIPNNVSGRTWTNFEGIESGRTCGFKPTSCPTPGAQ